MFAGSQIHLWISILNPLRANSTKWLNTLKQLVGYYRRICLSVFDHFTGLVLKGLSKECLNPLAFGLQSFPI